LRWSRSTAGGSSEKFLAPPALLRWVGDPRHVRIAGGLPPRSVRAGGGGKQQSATARPTQTGAWRHLANRFGPETHCAPTKAAFLIRPRTRNLADFVQPQRGAALRAKATGCLAYLGMTRATIIGCDRRRAYPSRICIVCSECRSTFRTVSRCSLGHFRMDRTGVIHDRGRPSNRFAPIVIPIAGTT
jgi:hypothetical protein